MTLAIGGEGAERLFGAGGVEPYARALLDPVRSALRLGPIDGDDTPLDMDRFLRPADAADLTLLARARGRVLDIGCGPGRMVRAALDAGLPAVGIDVSAAAVTVARRGGLPVLHRSVFERRFAGHWRTILLVDGNIGIGGDPVALLTRCAELLHPRGEIVVETHPDADRDRRYLARLTDATGEGSDVFPWAELGASALTLLARGVGLRVVQTWSVDDRVFCRLERSPR